MWQLINLIWLQSILNGHLVILIKLLICHSKSRENFFNLLSICCLSAILKSRISGYFEVQIPANILSKHRTISRYKRTPISPTVLAGIKRHYRDTSKVKSWYLTPLFPALGGEVVANDWCIMKVHVFCSTDGLKCFMVVNNKILSGVWKSHARLVRHGKFWWRSGQVEFSCWVARGQLREHLGVNSHVFWHSFLPQIQWKRGAV